MYANNMYANMCCTLSSITPKVDYTTKMTMVRK